MTGEHDEPTPVATRKPTHPDFCRQMAALNQVPMERFSDYRRVATPVFLHVYDVVLSGFPAQESRFDFPNCF